MSDTRDEAELLCAAVDGCKDSLAQLFMGYRGALLNYCERTVGDHHLAEDIVNECFIKVMGGIGEFDVRRRFWPWLQTIARRTCYDALRTNGRRKDASERNAGATVLRLVDHSEDVVEQVAASRSIAAGMRRLNPRYARVVYLREVEGWTYEELARADGSTESSIAKVLERAKTQLRATVKLPTWIPGLWWRFKRRLAILGGRQSAEMQPALASSAPVVLTVIAFGLGSILLPRVPSQPPPNQLQRTHSNIRAGHSSKSYTSSAFTSAAQSKSIGRSNVLTPTEIIEINQGRPHPNGADPTGGHNGVAVRSSDGSTLLYNELEIDCGRHGDVAPNGSPVSVYC